MQIFNGYFFTVISKNVTKIKLYNLYFLTLYFFIRIMDFKIIISFEYLPILMLLYIVLCIL